jgi:tetratricopeptide (TPR) repeat protein
MCWHTICCFLSETGPKPGQRVRSDYTRVSKVRTTSLASGAAMRISHFVCAVIITLLGCGSPSFAETAMEYRDKGEAAQKAKDYAKAVEYYTEALKLEPERNETIYARGVNYYKLKRYLDAWADFDKVKNVKQFEHRALNYIGLTYMAREKYEAALITFTQAAKLEPKSLLYCMNAARAALESGDLAKTVIWYKKALELDPSNKEADKYVKTRIAVHQRMQEQERIAAEARERAMAEKRWNDCMSTCQSRGGGEKWCELFCGTGLDPSAW